MKMQMIVLAEELIAMFSGVSNGGKLELRGIAEFRRSYHPEPMRLDFSLSSK